MKPKAITIFDLDGTLLNEKSEITKEVASAMSELKKNNVLPIIATGRTNIEIKTIAEAAGITSFITMNGQYVEIEGKGIYENKIEQKIVQDLLTATQAKGHELGFYTPEEIFVTGHTPVVSAAYEIIHSNIPPIDPKFYLKKPLNMLLVICENGDEFYKENFPELKFFRNGPSSMDTISKEGSKGHGIRKLIETLDYFDVPTYGFGDGPNDVELLGACDYKIAMGNAVPALKEVADFVTKKNTEGGIVHALRHYSLIE